jgi:hypothetical protein
MSPKWEGLKVIKVRRDNAIETVYQKITMMTKLYGPCHLLIREIQYLFARFPGERL